ncbi:hypothetical protein FLONG3_337 [Fusarium longipes]|uniref:RRM domain-containing protein n=1 Tax=Fusarium longipes TaxID=694270 RepID=A0A395TBF1_9HYPO|nr:hypothetical protein FLONG3_337 [Fusarium longipes]
MPTEATVQADVGPGNETGIYYITICNLPFGTSWQQLKDWTRSACVVDHIEVFQSSTSGWVRVRGRENFEKAWGLLNGGIFNGRSIIASDRNRNHSIKIRELAMPQQGTQIQVPRYPPAPVPPTRHVLPVPMTMAQPYSMTPEQYYMTGYSSTNGPRFTGHSIPPPGYTHQQSVTVTTTASLRPAAYAVIGPGSYYAYDLDTYAPQYQAEGTQFTLPYHCPDEHSDFYPESSFPSEESTHKTEYVVTEPRKLHVSPFPQQARADEVKSWIRRKVDKSKIISMEIPKNSNSRYLRGYVLVVFDSVSAANTAIEQLNKARFQGRRVVARPTREGAVVEQPGFSHETTSWSDPKLSETKTSTTTSHGRDEDRLQRPKNKEVRPTGSEKKRIPEKMMPYPSKKTSGTQSDKRLPPTKSPSQRELSRKHEGPVIVDGTCHRHDK